ncbi:PGPGW domain-containing protein [Propionibacteriaceae bacterium Y1700]|uniref:PGPGW domain-containing protein n=1 Tax=Microlunatus sp. Y1700 TaxID=3418487 RepID=UPI003DA73E4A
MGSGDDDQTKSSGDHPVLLDASDDRWRWRRRIRQDPRKAFFYRLGVGIVGGFFILLGCLTGPFPGPGGIPLVLLGLAIWASEFEWAQKLMLWFRAQLARVRRWPRWAKALIVIAIICCLMISLYTTMRLSGVPGWLPEPVQDALQQLPGL